MKIGGVLPAATALLAAADAMGAATLTLDGYLAQVRSGNPSVRAAEETVRALPLVAAEAELAYGTQLRGNARWTDDQAEGASALQPDRSFAGVFGLGLAKRFSTGTTAAFDYGLVWNRISMAPVPGFPASLAAGLFPSDPTFDVRPTLSLTQSLSRDWRGAQTDAGIVRARANAEAGAAAATHRSRLVRLQAEQAYWALALAQLGLEHAKASLARTRLLVARTRRKLERNLAERSDLLQVQATEKLRELAARSAELEVSNARRSFNTLRGTTGSAVDEPLEPIHAGAGRASLAARPVDARADVQAAAAAARAAAVEAREARLRTMPDVNAFASLTLNGRDTAFGDAAKESFGGERPTYVLGLSAVVPLDFASTGRVHAGYEGRARAAALELERARLDAGQEWDQLAARWRDVELRLTLAREIESLQARKLEAETKRFVQGRTTTFQVLAFEEDYAQAQLTRARMQVEKLLICAHARVFDGD